MGNVLIAGAGDGLGYALTEAFLRAGDHVAVLRRDGEALESMLTRLQAGRTPRVRPLVGDLSSEQVRSVLEADQHTHGAYTTVVFNPSRLRMGVLTELSAEHVLEDLNLVVGGFLRCVQSSLPRMAERGSGTVLVTGGGSSEKPWSAAASLGIQKSAVRNAAFALAGELRKTSIRVGVVTIDGSIAAGTSLDPELIASVFVTLAHQATPLPRETLLQ